ncbi:hypothetical protein ABIA30_004431 [Mycobacterium sp. MAA66]|uniref:hypothetical protein n=1 Tax=Mycobacterium sp. MAA66 TaxID=3156297 RepID=UPI003513917E
MRNLWRVVAFDFLVPLLIVAALVYIGFVLDWPMWWAAVAAVLALLVVQSSAVNFVLYRRDGVTLGTDDDRPGLRLIVVGIATVAAVAAAVVGYLGWTEKDAALDRDSGMVVGIASSVAEASATFTPGAPNASIDRAASLMVPQRADAYRTEFNKVAKDLTARGVSGQASTISAGVEAIAPDMASVVVILRGTQNTSGQPPKVAILSLRITLIKDSGRWLVTDVTPINAR